MRSELMGAFLDEVEEQLQLLEMNILQLEQEGESEQVIQSIFRTAHTLKGSSATMGFEQMKDLTHEMENVLDQIRRHRLPVSQDLVNVLFECLDMLGVLKTEIERTGTTHTNTDRIAAKLRALAQYAGGESAPPGAPAASAAFDGTPGSGAFVSDSGVRQAIGETRGRQEERNADAPMPQNRDAASLGSDGAAPGTSQGPGPAEPSARRIECRVLLAAGCEMKSARAHVIYQTLSGIARVLSTMPPMDDDMLQQGNREIIFVVETDLGLDELEALLLKEIDVEDVELRCGGENVLEQEQAAESRSQPGAPLEELVRQALVRNGLAPNEADRHGSARPEFAGYEPSVQASSAQDSEGHNVPGRESGKHEFEKDEYAKREPVRQDSARGTDAGTGRKEAETQRKTVQTIRVDVERLDNLMNLVGELVIDQTRIVQLSSMLRDVYHADEAFEDLEQISNHIARVISELQESVMKTRMLPIDRLFSRFPRMVRDLSQELGKEIELVLDGKETELDRTVIEEIGDPLIHLVRNSIDHGIESREERLKLGKPAKGMVRLSAMHQENHVVITVEDDGRGIWPDRIKASAVAKGLITEAAAESMSDREAIQLIFSPGFSTAQTVSDVSGRGVGMDIVRTHIEKLNGLIDVETKPGQGTKFTIKLPLTLAIVNGLLIKLGQFTYALPMSSVVEIVRIPQEDIQSVKGRPVVQIREQVMPLVWIHDHFRIPRVKRPNRNVFVVVVGVAERRLGLVVDELIGNQDIVVKSIGSYVGKVEGVSGATILGDGSVALILDVVGLMKLVSIADVTSMEDAVFAADEQKAADGQGVFGNGSQH